MGLIPAHAGKTRIAPCGRWGWRAHPRSRGENEWAQAWGWASRGSSPLTRGKRARHDADSPARGLIPAHAGKTRPDPAPRRLSAAHPRSRGENSAVGVSGRSGAGSSPLTRGKLTLLAPQKYRVGLIPAHAGKTSSGSRPPAPPRAHPRSRGENHPCHPRP